jgi:hypothetical protein
MGTGSGEWSVERGSLVRAFVWFFSSPLWTDVLHHWHCLCSVCLCVFMPALI